MVLQAILVALIGNRHFMVVQSQLPELGCIPYGQVSCGAHYG